MRSGASLGTSHDRRLWFVLGLFVAAVLLPTICVLWLLNDSIAKQQQIARQQLADAYRSQLKLVSEALDTYWREDSARLEARASNAAPSAAWADVVRSGGLDSAVLYDADGRLQYPLGAALTASPQEPAGPEWSRARQLEERLLPQYLEAAGIYGEVGENAKNPDVAARAFQAQIRCLRQAGDKNVAAMILNRFLAPGLHKALDSNGRVIAADALLMAIQILPAADPRGHSAAEALHAIVTDYRSSALPSAQRLFLMKEMKSAGLPDSLTAFPTLAAEELAAQAIESGMVRSFDAVLRPSGTRDVWTLGSPSGRVTGLLRTASVKARAAAFVEKQSVPPRVRIAVVEHGSETRDAIETIPLAAYLPAMRIALFPAGRQLSAELASRQMLVYLWVGALVLVAIVCITLLAGRTIHRQMRLANLKSDLVATVSHELKTPLASTRLLLDTLLDKEDFDPQQTREYLALMDQENTRLTQIIENFLAFSRLERNRYNFRFAEACPEEIVARAVEAFSERASEPNVRLHVEIAPGLPALHADTSALSTVLINLLDNAYKYTSDEKRIDLRAFPQNGSVCFEVQDNGIGLAKSEMSKVFRDFYQVDSRLARSRGGCGLGLSIVKFIVDAHHGSVSLDSQLGRGSTFKVAVPGTKS